MPPKPQTFKAPDGTEFSTRSEYRDYMMNTYYSFKNKKNITDILIKKPGDVDGQVFDIADCENCTLVVMDTCEQVQIDQVKNCKIFIGACTSSIFIRNCSDCIFYTCCRQLRLRDVTSSSFYIYSMAEVHIEFSNTLLFAPFNGGYPEQAQHFQTAKLDPNHNLWYDIFDHNDPGKTHANWALMPESDYEEPWYPMTKCTPVVPRTKPGSVVRQEEKEEMQAFGVQQMISDAIEQGHAVVPPKLASPPKQVVPSPPKSSPPKSSNNNNRKDQQKEEKIGTEVSLEVSLLIASASAKNIDISTWFNEGGFNGKLPVQDFNTKLISLSLIVGMEEDWETKRELEVAVSSISLKTIQHLCSSGLDKAKKPYIDVTKFIKLCKTKLAQEMGEDFDDDDDDIKEELVVEGDVEVIMDDVPVPEGISSEEIVEKYANMGLTSTIANSNQSDDVAAAPTRPSTARGSRVATKSEFETTKGRPRSAPSISTSFPASKKTDTINYDDNNLTPTKKVFAESLTLPDSPFDEEVVFNVEDEDDVDTAVGGVISKSKARIIQKSTTSKPTSSSQRAKPPVSAPVRSTTKPTTQSKPVRPASATIRPTKQDSEPIVPSKAVNRSLTIPSTSSSIIRPAPAQSSSFNRSSISRPRPASADPKHRYRTSVGTSIASIPYQSTASIYSQKTISTEDQLIHFEKLVEDKVRQNVKQADSYHTIQVHLGFISDYTMVPHRGIAVISEPRAWLSIKEIQSAFQAAYLRLPDAHMYALMRLVNKYAKATKESQPTGIVEDAVRTSTNNNPNSTVLSHSKISADWFKKYLVDLRLSKTQSSTRRSLSVSIARNNDTNEGALNTETEKPLAWEEWLGRKIVDQKRMSMEKPKEFKNALSGQAHGLTKDEINAMLMKHDIIPDDIFNNEIALKIKFWVLDAAGRRDFSHAFNVELKKVQTENKAAWAVADKRKDIATTIRANLIAKKEASLRKAEVDKAEITKSLYWEYADYCKVMKGCTPIPWGEWLKKHQDDLKDALNKIEKEVSERQRAGIIKKQRLQTVAPLNLVEQKLKEAADNMSNIDHGIELRKSIVALRKSAKELGISKGTLITKELFDKHLESVLAPRLLELPEDIRPLAQEARLSHISKAFFENGLDSLFTINKAEAEQQVIAIDSKKKEEEGSKFNEWLDKKRQIKEKQLEKEKAKKELLEKEASDRKRRAESAFKKWMSLRRSNRYVSKVDKKAHDVPQPIKVIHKIRWNKDVEILADN